MRLWKYGVNTINALWRSNWEGNLKKGRYLYVKWILFAVQHCKPVIFQWQCFKTILLSKHCNSLKPLKNMLENVLSSYANLFENYFS